MKAVLLDEPTMFVEPAQNAAGMSRMKRQKYGRAVSVSKPIHDGYNLYACNNLETCTMRVVLKGDCRRQAMGIIAKRLLLQMRENPDMPLQECFDHAMKWAANQPVTFFVGMQSKLITSKQRKLK